MKLSLRAILVIVIIILVLAVIAVSGIISTYVMKNGVTEAMKDKLHYDISSTLEILDRTYPGDWQIKKGKLYKKNILINGNTDLPDRIGVITGNLVNVYQGNECVSSNARNEKGERIAAGKVESEIEEVVLKQGEETIGFANYDSKEYLIGYSPLRGIKGDIIGIWALGVPIEYLNSMIAEQRVYLICTAVLALLISIIIIFILAGHIFKPVNKIIEKMQLVEEGNINVETGYAYKKNEVGKLALSFENMLSKLSDIVSKTKSVNYSVRDASNQLTSITRKAVESSQENSKNMEQVAVSNEEQSCNIEEISTAANKLSNNVNNLSEQIVDIKKYSDTVAKESKSGKESMNSMHQQIKNINDIVNKTSQNISILEEKSQKIGKITTTIGKIAANTTLLSINAAIEAASAGKDGNGFAVVAEEIRKLAFEAEKFSSEISENINQVQEQTEKSIKHMEQSVGEVEKGLDIVESTDEKFNKIMNSVNYINSGLENIVISSNDMKYMTSEIVDNISTASSNSEEVTAISNQVSETIKQQSEEIKSVNISTQKLNDLALEMEKSVELFKKIN